MRILILANYANGLYLFRRELVQAFIDEGHDVLVSVPPDENCDKLRNLGWNVIDTNLDRHGNRSHGESLSRYGGGGYREYKILPR